MKDIARRFGAMLIPVLLGVALGFAGDQVSMKSVRTFRHWIAYHCLKPAVVERLPDWAK